MENISLHDFHLLEISLRTLPELKIVNRPPADEDGRFIAQRFFTILYGGQFFCLEQEKEDMVLKIYLRRSPFTKQRAVDTIIIAEAPTEISAENIQRILDEIRDAPLYEKPRDGDPIQQIYGNSGLHPLSGFLIQLSKRFVDSLGERELYILNELDYIENPITTMRDKILVFTGKDSAAFTYDLSRMIILD
jgi:hypothetical protein